LSEESVKVSAGRKAILADLGDRGVRLVEVWMIEKSRVLSQLGPGIRLSIW
jgi:hypothetical protein